MERKAPGGRARHRARLHAAVGRNGNEEREGGHLHLRGHTCGHHGRMHGGAGGQERHPHRARGPHRGNDRRRTGLDGPLPSQGGAPRYGAQFLPACRRPLRQGGPHAYLRAQGGAVHLPELPEGIACRPSHISLPRRRGQEARQRDQGHRAGECAQPAIGAAAHQCPGVHGLLLRGRPHGAGGRQLHRGPRAQQPLRRDDQRRADARQAPVSRQHRPVCRKGGPDERPPLGHTARTDGPQGRRRQACPVVQPEADADQRPRQYDPRDAPQTGQLRPEAL